MDTIRDQESVDLSLEQVHHVQNCLASTSNVFFHSFCPSFTVCSALLLRAFSRASILSFGNVDGWGRGCCCLKISSSIRSSLTSVSLLIFISLRYLFRWILCRITWLEGSLSTVIGRGIWCWLVRSAVIAFWLSNNNSII